MSDLISKKKVLECIGDAINKICNMPTTHDNARKTHECDNERTETHDLISRKAAIERIRMQMDRPDSVGQWAHNDKIAKVCYEIVIEALENLPSAEPETIVRCKDCKYKYIEEKVWNCPFGLSGGEDFFCSYGARMDGESE